MNFKLKFHTSATTTLETYEIVANVQIELKEKKYNVINIANSSVTFKDNLLRFRSSWSPTTLDEGEFHIRDDASSKRQVTLSYYYNFLYFILFFALIVVVSIFQNDYINILALSIFYCVIIPIDVLVHLGKAKELINAVLQTST